MLFLYVVCFYMCAFMFIEYLFMHIYLIASSSLKCHDMLGIRMHSLPTLALHVSLKCGVIRFRLCDRKRLRLHDGVHVLARWLTT